MTQKRRRYPLVDWAMLLTISAVIFAFGIYLGTFVTRLSYESVRTDQNLTAETFISTTTDGNFNLVFFKEDCPYCQGAKSDVLRESKDSSYPTFWIDLNTSDGKLIKTQYAVKYAATIVSVRGAEPTSYLYAEKEAGKYVSDEQAIELAFKDDLKGE